MLTMHINLINKALAQFTNFNFNSYCHFCGKYLGANSDGIFELTGETDNGSHIKAMFEPVMTDFGISHPKRMRFVYIGMETYGDLSITCMPEGEDSKTYTIEQGHDGQQRRRVAIGRDNGYGHYWTFRIENRDGCDFSVDSIDILPVVLPNGHN